MSRASAVRIGEQVLERLFPFYVGFDRELVVTGFGPSAQKALPRLEFGAALSDVVRIIRPRIDIERIRSIVNTPVAVEPSGGSIELRGQVVDDSDSESAMLLVSPWFQELEEFERSGFELSDFSLNDPMLDFLFMKKGMQTALEDLRRLSSQIEQQRDTLKRQYEDLRQANEANAFKNQFLANTSHELRTPLNGILGMASLLLRTELTTRQRNYASKIVTATESLSQVINDILDVARIEAGKLSIERIEFPLRDVVHETVEMFAVTASNKNLELLCKVDLGVPDWAVGDPTRVRQLLANLLGNAVKFTHEGEIVVTVGLEPDHEDTLALRCSVSDTGIGIDPKDHDRVFESFSQVEGDAQRAYQGAGLGLAICKQLAELMGGSMGVTSEVGRGSTFWFVVELGRSQRSASPQLSCPDELRERRVLVVDDNATNRQYLTGLFSHWGIGVDEADDGEGAIERLRVARQQGQPFDVVVSDFHMPGMTGPELARLLRGETLLGEPRFVLLSSVGTDEIDRAEGIDAQLEKPVRPQQLLQAMAQLAGVTQADAHARGRSESGKSLRVLIVDDNAINREVTGAVVEELGHIGDFAEHGAAAVAMIAGGAYDVILMDCQMPVMDGYEATREIRRREAPGAHATIIALTAHAMASDRQRALDAGMDDYVAKPVRIEDLERALNRCGTEAAGRAPASVLPADERAPLDLSVLEDLAALSRSKQGLVERVVTSYLRDLPEQRARVETAYERGETREVADAAHALKSCSLHVGAREVSELASALELAARQGELEGEAFAALKQACVRAEAALREYLRGCGEPSDRVA